MYCIARWWVFPKNVILPISASIRCLSLKTGNWISASIFFSLPLQITELKNQDFGGICGVLTVDLYLRCPNLVQCRHFSSLREKRKLRMVVWGGEGGENALIHRDLTFLSLVNTFVQRPEDLRRSLSVRKSWSALRGMLRLYESIKTLSTRETDKSHFKMISTVMRSL